MWGGEITAAVLQDSCIDLGDGGHIFKTPFSCQVVGSSQSGKSSFLRDVIREKNRLFSSPPNRILFVYGVYQPLYDKIKDENVINEIIFHKYEENKPIINQVGQPPPDLLILDDLFTELSNDKSLLHIFTKYAHHFNMSTFLVQHFLYGRAPIMRQLSLNSQYICLFRNHRDVSAISTLARQLVPGKLDFLKDSYQDATSKPFGYLLVDLHPSTPNSFRFKTNIFRERGEFTVYYIDM